MFLSQGDEIIVPDITWVASASPILYCGAKPVFCDIDKKIGVLILGLLKSQLQKKQKLLSLLTCMAICLIIAQSNL